MMLLIVASFSFAVLRRDLNERQALGQQAEAPSLGNAYSYLGRGTDGMRLGLSRYPPSPGYKRGVSWRVNSPGTKNCSPAGHEALWNFIQRDVPVDPRGRFSDAGSYTSPDTTAEGGYAKRVSYKMQGRFLDPRTATGTFWRRDRYYRYGSLSFECMRAGRWKANSGEVWAEDGGG